MNTSFSQPKRSKTNTALFFSLQDVNEQQAENFEITY